MAVWNAYEQTHNFSDTQETLQIINNISDFLFASLTIENGDERKYIQDEEFSQSTSKSHNLEEEDYEEGEEVGESEPDEIYEKEDGQQEEQA